MTTPLELEDEVAAARLYARQVAEALTAGSLDRPERLPAKATRGWVGSVLAGVLAVVLTGVITVVVVAISHGRY